MVITMYSVLASDFNENNLGPCVLSFRMMAVVGLWVISSRSKSFVTYYAFLLEVVVEFYQSLSKIY